MSAKKPWAERTCEECGKVFHIPYSKVKRGRGRYCSAHCLGLANARRVNKIRKPATHNPSWFKSENVRGEKNVRWVDPLKFCCEQCGETFELKPWIVRQPSNKARFCSRACLVAHRKERESGENSPFWVGGVTTCRGRGWQEIRLKVIDRQDGKCAHCGNLAGKSLPVHHIIPFREFDSAEEANSLGNLIGLCQSCHMKEEYAKHKRPQTG